MTPLPSQVPEAKKPTRHPERRGRHTMAIIKISEALTYDTNSRFALIIVKPTSVGLFSHQWSQWCISRMFLFVAVFQIDH